MPVSMTTKNKIESVLDEIDILLDEMQLRPDDLTVPRLVARRQAEGRPITRWAARRVLDEMTAAGRFQRIDGERGRPTIYRPIVKTGKKHGR